MCRPAVVVVISQSMMRTSTVPILDRKEQKKSLQRAHSQTAPGVPQPGRGDLRQGQAAQHTGEFGPHRRVAALLEQRGGQEGVDHDPGGQYP